MTHFNCEAYYSDQSLRDYGFKLIQLEVEDLLYLKNSIESEMWTPDLDGLYKEIPCWANRHLRVPQEKYESFDDCAVNNVPEHYQSWCLKIVKKYLPTFITKGINPRIDICLWNGSGESKWHGDNDGKSTNLDSFTFLLYHIPIPLKDDDGGFVSIKQNKASANSIDIFPLDGMGILLEVKSQNFLHRAQKVCSHKDRYTLSIGLKS